VCTSAPAKVKRGGTIPRKANKNKSSFPREFWGEEGYQGKRGKPEKPWIRKIVKKEMVEAERMTKTKLMKLCSLEIESITQGLKNKEPGELRHSVTKLSKKRITAGGRVV